jgi:hypothetical protein
MNTLQFNFIIAFTRRNRALYEVATDEQIQHIIEDAFDKFEIYVIAFSDTPQEWLDQQYKGWAYEYCLKARMLDPDIRAALLHD